MLKYLFSKIKFTLQVDCQLGIIDFTNRLIFLLRSNHSIMSSCQLKGCVCYIFASLFSRLKESTCKTWKNVFFLLQKVFLFVRKSNLRILVIQILWRHQMPKYKTRNTFCWITWKVSTVCQWNLTSLCHIAREKILSKTSGKTVTWNLDPGLVLFGEN